MIELRQGFFRDSRPVMRDLRETRRELAVESVRKHPDSRRINKLARKIGQAHVRLAEMRSRHLRDVASVLDDRQLERFMNMKDNPHGRHSKRG